MIINAAGFASILANEPDAGVVWSEGVPNMIPAHCVLGIIGLGQAVVDIVVFHTIQTYNELCVCGYGCGVRYAYLFQYIYMYTIHIHHI